MSYQLYLPLVEAHNGMTFGALMFAQRWMQVLGDSSKAMHPHPKLVQAAQGHANYLSARTFEQIEAMKDVPHAMHRGAGGSYANERVLVTGFRLPLYWHSDANNVESCARSPFDPAQAAEDLAAHGEHYDHMHSINWFADHVLWGVGSAGQDYVVVTAPLEARL